MTEGLSASDVALLSNGNDGMFGGNGAWWIVLFLIFGWGRNGFGNSGANDNYVLTSDFSQLSRQISDSTAMTERKLDGITNGICSLGYDQLVQMNGINQNISNTNFALSKQISDCCCTNRYDALQNATATQSAIQNGFCTTNFNNQTNTRDIIDAQNAGTRAILEAIESNKVEALNQKIAEQNQTINALQLSASQSAQNQYLVNQLRPSPVPSYVVQNPYCSCGQTFGSYYGTTIA